MTGPNCGRPSNLRRQRRSASWPISSGSACKPPTSSRTVTNKATADMLHKIQETKTNLLSLKKEQLSTTTRLTVLQNHQLTSELEYQSKQTEKLLFKNEELQNKVTNLQRDLEIHKQVEQELAKRSHFSRGIIKKLSQRVKEL